MFTKMKEADLVESGEFDLTNNTYGNFCLKWSAEEFELWKMITVCISSVGLLACVLAIICILVSKGCKKFVHRLTLYLIIAVLFHAFVSILEAVSVYYNGTVVATREDLESVCAAAGFLSIVADWMELLVICWIVIYLVMVLVFKYSAHDVKRKHEIYGLAVILVLPFLINWLPFVIDKNMYGLSGGECWIKPSVKSYCDYDGVGLTLMFVFSYVPAFLVCLITFVSFGTIAIVMCKRALQQEQGLRQPSVHQQGLKEVLPLLLYPPIYFLFWMIVVATRIINVLQKVQFQFSVTLAHYVVFLLVALLMVPLVFLLHSSINFCRKKRNKLHTPSITTSYIVPNECSDQEDERLIIKGKGIKVPSREYGSIFEGNTEW